MGEFRIDVLLDPDTAGARQISNQLKRLDDQASRVGAELRRALSSRQTQTQSSLAGIERTLGGIQQRALITDARLSQLGRDIKTGGIDRFNSRLRDTQAQAATLGQVLRRTFVFLGGAALIRGAVRGLADFEQSMANVRAVSGATEGQFKALREEAARLGLTTRFTATQAADALTQLSRAGFSVSEGLEAVDDTLNLAVAGNLSLKDASDITATAIRGFRLEVDQAQRATDVLAATANSSNTTVEQLGEALKFVAPVAAGLGVSIETTSAALGSLSDAGLKASLAGTGFRRVLSELESPSTKTVKLLNSLKVRFDEVQPSTNNLVDVLTRLRDAGVDTGLALELFGDRGGPAFEVLSSSIPKIIQAEKALGQVQGTAARTASTVDDNLNGALIRASSALNGLNLALGEAGANNALRGLAETSAVALRTLAANIEVTSAALLGLATAVIPRVLAAFLGLTPAISVAVGGLAGFNKALLAGGAIVAGFTFAINKLLGPAEDVKKALDELEADAAFARQGQQIRLLQQEYNNLERAIEAQRDRGFLASPSQLRRQDEAIEKIDQLKRAIRDQSAAQKQQEDLAKSRLPTFDNTIARLEREAELIKLGTEEGRIQAEVQKEVNALIAAGEGTTSTQREAIEARLRQNQALRDQRSLLDEIKAAEEASARQAAAVNAAREQGLITLSQAKALLESDVAAQDPFIEQVRSLEEQNQKLEIRTGHIGAHRDLLLLELEIFGELLEADDARRVRLEGLLSAQRRLTDEIQRQKDTEAIESDIQGLRDQITIKRRLIDFGETEAQVEKFIIGHLKAKRDLSEQQVQAYRRQLIELKEISREESDQRRVNALKQELDIGAQIAQQRADLLRIGREEDTLADEASRALEDLRIRELEISENFGAGFERAFLRMSQEARDFAAVADQIVDVFADRATDAINEFVTTGELDFRKFADSILQELQRILIRLLVVQALSAAFGPGAGAVGGQAVAQLSRQRGGTVQPGQTITVGESGPEVFVPQQTGTIIPNQAGQQQAPPQVNLQAVVVQSEEMIPQALSSGAADEALIVRIGANRDRINQQLGIG